MHKDPEVKTDMVGPSCHISASFECCSFVFLLVFNFKNLYNLWKTIKMKIELFCLIVYILMLSLKPLKRLFCKLYE